MTPQEFEAAGDLGRVAAEALPALKELPGFLGLRIVNGSLVVTGTGDEVQKAAQELGATFESPAGAVPGDVLQDAGATDEESEDAAAPGTAKYAADVASLRAAYVARFGYTGLQSVMWTGGSYVIKVDKAALGSASARSRTAVNPVEDFVSEYANVSVAEVNGPTEAFAGEPENVVNGQGYAGSTAAGLAVCSIGFSAFSPTGAPAALTAGHCSEDGLIGETVLTDPTGDSAGIGPDELGTFPWMELGALQSKLGTFGFSQFGGPGNAPALISPEGEVLPESPVGSDIAVIDGINPALDLLPEVTQWETPTDLTDTAVEVTGIAAPTIGAPVCKSGRTTGWSCDIVTGFGEFFVAGRSYATNPADIRGVSGFEAGIAANHGDSGGPMISGSLAVGIASAGGTRIDEDLNEFPVLYAVDLASALPLTGGYTVRVHVGEPALTSVADGGTVSPGGQLSGTAPAGTTLEASINGEPVPATVGADGAWTLPVPENAEPGTTVELSLRAMSGFSASATVSYELTLDYPQLEAPAITSPAESSVITSPVTEVAGTGTPGATVTLTAGADTAARALPLGMAEVSASGDWTIALDPALGYGEHLLNATQDGVSGRTGSAAASALISVVYPAPLITSVQDGQVFEMDEAPETISGTGFPGAGISLSIGGATSTGTVDGDGEWTVQIPVPSAGAHTLVAAQQLDGVPSLTSSISITVNEMPAAPVGTPAPLPTAPGNDPTPGTPAPLPTAPGNDPTPGTPAPLPTAPGNDPTPGTPAPLPTAPGSDPAAASPASTGSWLADTGASGRLGLFGGIAAALVVLGIAAMIVSRRRKN